MLEADDAPNTHGQDFPEALRVVRRHRKISQESLAQSLSVSRQSVSKWESGKAEPDADHLIALAKHLKVSLSQLLQGVDAEQPIAQPVKKEKPAPAAKKAKKIEAPKVETPKTETPKVEAPKVEVPKIKAPKIESPKAELPKVKTKPAPEPVSRRQLLQERVRLAGQKERAAKAALGIKKK